MHPFFESALDRAREKGAQIVNHKGELFLLELAAGVEGLWVRLSEANRILSLFIL